MIYVVKPRLAREIHRAFKFDPLPEGEQYDYSINTMSMEVPFHKAAMWDDRRKTVTKAKPGDCLYINAKLKMTVTNRIIHVELHPSLYVHGTPTFRRIYKHGEKMFTGIFWTCVEALDLEKLPYLYEAYIVDEVVK